MTNPCESFLLGHGFYYEELTIGFRFHTKRRTLCEADLNAYLNLTWFTEELFVNLHSHDERALTGRVVPAGLVFCFAEGLVHPSMENTGQAFLGMTLDVRHPSYIGDTIHTECEVIEARVESKGRRGLVRTENRVVNQKSETVVIYKPLRLVRLRVPVAPHPDS